MSYNLIINTMINLQKIFNSITYFIDSETHLMNGEVEMDKNNVAEEIEPEVSFILSSKKAVYN